MFLLVSRPSSSSSQSVSFLHAAVKRWPYRTISEARYLPASTE